MYTTKLIVELQNTSSLKSSLCEQLIETETIIHDLRSKIADAQKKSGELHYRIEQCNKRAFEIIKKF